MRKYGANFVGDPTFRPGQSGCGCEFPIELFPVDLGRYRAGNTGIPYVASWDGRLPGPHVLLAALVHGNELCGALALDTLLGHRLRPRRGRLTFAFVNVAAYMTFDCDLPNASRYLDEDLNRVWDAEVLDGPRDSLELRRARELRPLIDQVDVMLDLHSMQHPGEPLALAGPLPKGRTLAAQVGTPALVVSDAGHKAGRRLRDYGPFADPARPNNALLVECGQHWQQASATTALSVSVQFLARLGVIDESDAAPFLPAAPAPAVPQRFIEVTEAVTIGSPGFQFLSDFQGMEIVARRGTVIAHDGDRPVATPYDQCVLIMPSRRRTVGQTAVRFGRFLDEGD